MISTRRMHRIIDAKFKNDLNKVITKTFQRLYTKEIEMLLKLLPKFGAFFDGTLGTWETAPVDLELKDDAKPVCLQPYPVPSVEELVIIRLIPLSC